MKAWLEKVRSHPTARTMLRVRDKYQEDDVGLLASALAYHGFLSLFPLLLVGAAILGFVFERDPSARAWWALRLSDALPGMGGMVEDLLVRTSRAKAVAGAAGVAGLIWTGTGAVRAASAALCRVFGCRTRGNLPKDLVWAIWCVAILGTVFVVSATATSVVGSVEGEGTAGLALGIVAFAFGLVMDFVLFMVAYRLLTKGAGPPFRKLIAGSVVAAVGWSMLRLVGVWYFTRSLDGAQAAYGVLAGAIAVLVILSMGARLFMAGAALNAVLNEPAVSAAAEPQAVLASGTRS